jgi:hypothetical protein
MAYGLQIFDSSGNNTLEVTDSLTKFMATFVTGINDGSTTVAGLSGKRIWLTCYRVPNQGLARRYTPLITISGDTVSWAASFSGIPSGNRASARVFVGIY